MNTDRNELVTVTGRHPAPHRQSLLQKYIEGTMNFINGSVRDYRQIEVEDAQFLFDIYGDETTCDGDKQTATQFVHLDADFEAVKKCDS